MLMNLYKKVPGECTHCFHIDEYFIWYGISLGISDGEFFLKRILDGNLNTVICTECAEPFVCNHGTMVYKPHMAPSLFFIPPASVNEDEIVQHRTMIMQDLVKSYGPFEDEFLENMLITCPRDNIEDFLGDSPKIKSVPWPRNFDKIKECLMASQEIQTVPEVTPDWEEIKWSWN
jgi:hypothetical protein